MTNLKYDISEYIKILNNQTFLRYRLSGFRLRNIITGQPFFVEHDDKDTILEKIKNVVIDGNGEIEFIAITYWCNLFYKYFKYDHSHTSPILKFDRNKVYIQCLIGLFNNYPELVTELDIMIKHSIRSPKINKILNR